jgi:20S proteasome subunit alpha 1
MSRNIGYDRHITVFSPEGKLFQIEYAFKAIRLPSDTTIGVRGTDTVCLITTKKVEDKLIVPASVSRMFRITPSIGCVVTGRFPDGRALIYKARSIAADFKFDNGFDIPVRHLAQEVANYNQIFTQHAYKRVPGISMIFCALDDELGPRLYMVDPAGASYGYKAVASGQKEQEAMSALEKLLKEKQEEVEKDKEKDKDKKLEMNYQQTVEAAIESLQKVLGVDFKSNQVEVAVVTKDDPQFRLLSEKEIDQFLTAISEKD